MNKLVKNVLIGIVLVAALVGSLIGVKQVAVYYSRAREEIGKPISGVKVTGLTANGAILVWETEKPALSAVVYGIDPLNLSLSFPELAETANHQVVLSNLAPETTYYFKIKVGEKVFDQNGSPYTFTTQASAPETPRITEEEIENALGTSNPKYDLNQDGVVNSLDILLFREQNK